MKMCKKLMTVLSASVIAMSTMGCASQISAKEDSKGKQEEQVIAGQATVQEETSWKTDYANLVGQQALIYGFPVAKYSRIMTDYNEKAKANGQAGTINVYNHAPKLLGPEFQGGTSMNRDTLYSLGFVDLSDGPLVFTIGDNIDGRYYSIEFTDFYSDCIGYMGTRETKNKAAAYLIHAPGWEGEIPEGIDKVIESRTNWILACGRTFTTNTEEDLKIAHEIQKGYKIYPVNEWGKENPQEAPAKGELPEVYEEDNILSYFDYMNTWMKMVGYPQRDEEAMKNFALVGLGALAEESVFDLDPEIQKGLEMAYVNGMELMDKTSFNLGSILNLNRVVNGWTYNPQNWGRMAETGDFLGRAATQAYSGGTENLVEEAVKLRTFTDQNGDNLNGSNKYEIKFEANQIPQVDAFWSITAYDNKYNVVANEANKYELRDIDPDLKYGEDGSLVISLQSEKPEDPNANWLPIPEGVDFNLFFRAYLPGEEFINQTYAPPAVTRVGQ